MLFWRIHETCWIHKCISGNSVAEMGTVSMETRDVEIVLPNVSLHASGRCLTKCDLSADASIWCSAGEATHQALTVYQATQHQQPLSVLLLFLLLQWAATWEAYGIFRWKPTVLQASGSNYWVWQCRWAENRTTLQHWNRHFYPGTAAQSISTVMEIRQGANWLCWSKKKKVDELFWGIVGHLQWPGCIHGRNDAYPGSQILFLKISSIEKGFICANKLDYTGSALWRTGGMPSKLVGKNNFFLFCFLQTFLLLYFIVYFFSWKRHLSADDRICVAL